jgi:hypothetical protein
MVLDDKHPSTWTEADLQRLCDESQRETQRLEFKRELRLGTNQEKREAERDAMAMANGGGGVIVYGIEEAALDDGGTAASELRPLADGSLYERFNSLLDDRGEPRLSFDLYPVDGSTEGIFLVLDIAGRRRPHRAHDGRYYGRRGTSARHMTEAEVADAYRERFIRDQRALAPLTEEPAQDGELPPDVADRIHRGLELDELALWREETGEEEPPGWMSVVVYPEPRQPDLLDPVHHRDRFETIEIPERWDPDHMPMAYFQLQPTVTGLRSQLPPRDDVPPAYLVALYRDGIMEYGTTLAPALRHENPAENRIIFTASHPQQAHDYLQAFGVALRELGYQDALAAQVSFYNTRGVNLGISRSYFAPHLHPINESDITGRLWHFSDAGQLLESSGRVVKQVMDLAFLAGGIESGIWFIDDEGNWTDARAG